MPVGEKGYILVVDDEVVIRALIREALTAKGKQVIEASTGKEGLEKTKLYPISVVFLDINLPDESGLELLGKFKELGTEVIMITGSPSLELTIQALREGASDFLIKPFTISQLYESLNRIETKLSKQHIAEDTHKGEKELLELLRKKTQEQALLYTIHDRLLGVNSLEELYHEVLKMGIEFTGSKGACFMFLDEDGCEFEEKYCEGEKYPKIKDLEPTVLKVTVEGEPYLVKSDKNKEPDLLFYPFKLKRRSIGCFILHGKEYGDTDVFAMGLVIERARPIAENFILSEQIVNNLYESLRALVTALEAKDLYTKEHSERVTSYSVMIGEKLGLPKSEMESLRIAAHLHDIGKVGVSDVILTKPGKLEEKEFEEIIKHPVIGAQIVEHIGMLKYEAKVIRHHHERWDGKGYPDGLKGEKIPLLSRIIAVADAFDAMTSTRSYRKALSFKDAFKEIVANIGKQFDPDVAKAFLTACREDPERVKQISSSRVLNVFPLRRKSRVPRYGSILLCSIAREENMV